MRRSWSSSSKMLKSRLSPTRPWWMRSNRAQVAWKVPIHIMWAAEPSSARNRSRISPAALLLNVTARISCGQAPRSTRRWMRLTRTRVLPEPAPASTHSGPSPWSTAACCAGLRPSAMLAT